MNSQQAMETDITYWVETLGYEAVIDAVRDVCRYYATAPDEEVPQVVPECPPSHWATREQALLHALWEER